ncbi:MAG TPA: glycosyltransferase family 4 protein, partial [Cytophagaceae bacterium]
MTVGIVTPYFPDSNTRNSGIANHYYLLAEALKNAGHSVIIIHVRPKYGEEHNDYEKNCLPNGNILLTYKVGIPSLLMKLLRNKWSIIDFLLKLNCMLLVYKNMSSIIKKYNIEVIETTSYFSLCYLYLLRDIQIPFILRVSTTFLQMMDTYYPFNSRLLSLIGLLEINFIKRNKNIITHAHNHAIELENLYQIDRTRFRIIPHGINLPNKVAQRTNVTHPLKILYVGRLEYRKGTDILLKAIPLVLNIYNDIHFEIIGTDRDNKYQTEFRNKNSGTINERVTFFGEVDNEVINASYAGCDIFVAPSRYESFGLIYIEAMSYSKPVIACKVGGVPEIVINGWNGLFSDPEDPINLAQKIIYLVEHPEK